MKATYNSHTSHTVENNSRHKYNLQMDLNIDDILDVSNGESSQVISSNIDLVREEIFRITTCDFIPQIAQNMSNGEKLDTGEYISTDTNINHKSEGNHKVSFNGSLSSNQSINMEIEIDSSLQLSPAQAFYEARAIIGDSLAHIVMHSLRQNYLNENHTKDNSKSIVNHNGVDSYDYRIAA